MKNNIFKSILSVALTAGAAAKTDSDKFIYNSDSGFYIGTANPFYGTQV